MSLVKVWDKSGELFEVSTLNAHDLVTHCGWSRTGPKVTAPEAEVKAVESAAEEASEEAEVKAVESAAEEASEEASTEDAKETKTRGRPRKQ